MENQKKKSLKWLWITIAIVVVGAIAAWCVYNVASGQKQLKGVFSIASLLFGLFIIVSLGYMLCRITIKGVNLGTAGVFLVAIAFGLVCTFIPADMPVLGVLHLHAADEANGIFASENLEYYANAIADIGLVLFVGSVGFIAGPKFFRDLKKNFKTYILMGVLIILAGTATAVVCALISPAKYGSDFWAGVLSGALTSTPGYSAATEAMKLKGLSYTDVTIGHAIAYPFGVVGVVLFVQILPKMLKANMDYERGLLKPEVLAATEEKPKKNLFTCDDFGLTAFALAVISGLLVGAIKIPLFSGVSFSLGTTGGVLIMCLVFGHFGRIGKMSLEVPEHSTKVLKELGLMLFLIGAGVEGGVNLIAAVGGNLDILAWGFIGGAIQTIVPMIIGFIVGSKMLKLPLLNNLGSITGGMTSTPALGALISTAKTDDVAGSYASTYPIALVLIVISCNLMVGLLPVGI